MFFISTYTHSFTAPCWT